MTEEAVAVPVAEGICLPALDTHAQYPIITSLNVTKKSRLHLGPKFVTVTQNVTQDHVVKGLTPTVKTVLPQKRKLLHRQREQIKRKRSNKQLPALQLGRFLGLELHSSNQERRCRCGIIVFVCWASVVACCLIALILHFLLPQPKRLDIGLKEPWYLRRGDWQAMPAYGIEYMKIPLKNVVVGHSALNTCNERYQCINEVLTIQQDHLRRDFLDIGPNFLIGGSGYVFEGRGANVCGAMVSSWNTKIISIMFLGDYSVDKVDEKQLNHMKVLLDTLVAEKILVVDYEISGKCQIATETISPGAEIMAKLKEFPNWNPHNEEACLSITMRYTKP